VDAVAIYQIRGLLELALGRDSDALAAFRAAERLAGHFATPHLLVPLTQARLLEALVRLGETERAERTLAELGEQDREPPLEPISDTDIRVLRYLPTNLSISDIASELYVLPNTVKTHIRHLYGKLGTHRRSQPVTAPAPSACSHPLDGADPGLAGAGLR
jgi:LuxR family maltose regulon positive regulatory protein